MTSFRALQLMNHSKRAGGACGKKHVELQSRERGLWGAGRKSVCVHMKVKCLHCSGNCGWKMKQCKGGGKDTVTNEWEHCRKKRRESILEIKLPLLQDNLRTLTMWRWAEAERQLRSSEGRRRRRRGGEASQLSRSKCQNSPMTPLHTHTDICTHHPPPPAPRWGRQTSAMSHESNQHPHFFFFTPYSSHPCISRSRITVTFTHMRIGSVIVKDAQIWQQESCKSCHRSSLKEKKTQAWAGCLQCQRERERERKESYSSAFLIELLWQPIGGQAALTAANQKKGLASQCCCSPKQWQLALMTVSAWSSDGDSRAHTLTYKYMHAHIDTHTWE